jgi:hypothetical protein
MYDKRPEHEPLGGSGFFTFGIALRPFSSGLLAGRSDVSESSQAIHQIFLKFFLNNLAFFSRQYILR